MTDDAIYLSGDLTQLFDTKREEATGETLEQLRDNYYIAARMNGSEGSSVGGLNINTSGRQDAASITKKKQKQATSDMIMAALLESQLAAIEGAMIDKYGEDFAEQFAAELLDEDTYNTLMEIEDPEERRNAIAEAISKGIEDGSIDADSAYRNPDFKEWLDKHSENRDHRSQQDHSYSATTDKDKAEQNHGMTDGNEEEMVFESLFSKGGPPIV